MQEIGDFTKQHFSENPEVQAKIQEWLQKMDMVAIGKLEEKLEKEQQEAKAVLRKRSRGRPSKKEPKRY